MPVCPTGASYKRKSDGIVLVDYDKCIGCKYCAWACPYGAREIDEARQVMTKCTLCVDRIDDATLPRRRPQAGLRQGVPDRRAPVRRREGSATPRSRSAIRERGGYALMPEWETRPANQYLPRRITAVAGATAPTRERSARRARPTSRRRACRAMNPAFSVVVFTTVAGAGAGARRRARARAPRRRADGAGVRSARACWSRSCCSSSAWRRRSSTSAGPSAPGARRRCGAPRGCRARSSCCRRSSRWSRSGGWRCASRRRRRRALAAAGRRHRRRGAALVLHRDDLRVPALHRGVGASADDRQLRAHRPVVGRACWRARWRRWPASARASRSPAPCGARRDARRLGVAHARRCAATPRSAIARRCRARPASAPARLVQTSMGMSAGSFNTREFFHRASRVGAAPHQAGVAIVLGFALPGAAAGRRRRRRAAGAGLRRRAARAGAGPARRPLVLLRAGEAPAEPVLPGRVLTPLSGARRRSCRRAARGAGRCRARRRSGRRCGTSRATTAADARPRSRGRRCVRAHRGGRCRRRRSDLRCEASRPIRRRRSRRCRTPSFTCAGNWRL